MSQDCLARNQRVRKTLSLTMTSSNTSVVYTLPFLSLLLPLSSLNPSFLLFSSSLSSPLSPLTGSYKLHKLPPSVSSLFSVASHSGKQLRQFKYSVHTLVVATLSHKAFLTKVKCSTVYHSILYYTPVYYSILYYTPVYYSILQYITIYSSILWYITVCLLQYTLVYYSIL